jgi:hypothetical protein
MKKFKRPALMLLVGALVVAVIQYVNREPEVNVEEELFGQYRLLTKYRAMAKESAGLTEGDKLEGEASEYEKRLLSGSGPAYLFLVMESLIDAGVLLGLPRAVARTLVIQTTMGSAKLLDGTEAHPGALKDQVASPGGTTIHGLAVLERGGVRGLLIDAVAAAARRSEQLGMR